MLAASLHGSNVPPDDLQAAPILALLAAPPKRFREHPPTRRPNAYPGPVTQHNAARFQACRPPFTASIQDVDCAIVGHAQPPTRMPGTLQQDEIPD